VTDLLATLLLLLIGSKITLLPVRRVTIPTNTTRIMATTDRLKVPLIAAIVEAIGVASTISKVNKIADSPVHRQALRTGVVVAITIISTGIEEVKEPAIPITQMLLDRRQCTLSILHEKQRSIQNHYVLKRRKRPMLRSQRPTIIRDHPRTRSSASHSSPSHPRQHQPKPTRI
jgi:hypothetical protein